LLLAGVLSFSALTVYTQYVFLQTTDHVTNRAFRDTSLEQYHEILEGRRPFPYQWRVAGPWLVRIGELVTGRDPHQIDLVVKVMALAASALLLTRFTALWTTPLGAITAGALYFVLTATAYSSEGYSIYYTNDFLMVLGWNAAVLQVARKRFGWAALTTFLTVWAKETVLFIPILVALGWWRGRASRRDVLLCAAAFLIPTLFLRTYYPARFAYWAWWGNVTLNIPFLRPDRTFVLIALRDNLKLLVFFNVLWVLAYRAFARTSDRFLRDLVAVGLLYTATAYVVIYIRELRHFLPLAIIVIPLAVAELEEILGLSGPPQAQRHAIDAAG
jgi:hypothetical protein